MYNCVCILSLAHNQEYIMIFLLSHSQLVQTDYYRKPLDQSLLISHPYHTTT